MQRVLGETLEGKRIQTKSRKKITKFAIKNLIEWKIVGNANEQR